MSKDYICDKCDDTGRRAGSDGLTSDYCDCHSAEILASDAGLLSISRNIEPEMSYWDITHKETLAEARMTYVKYDSNLCGHVLHNPGSGHELWVANKNHASYGIIFRNTHLEFVRSLPGYMV